MKEKILKYLKHDRSHTGGVTLYNEVGNRISLKRQLNVQPEDGHLTAVLQEELRVLAGISLDDFRVLMSNPTIPFQESPGNPPVAPAKGKPAGKGKSQGSKKASGKGKNPTAKKPAQPKKKAEKKVRTPKTPEKKSPPVKKEEPAPEIPTITLPETLQESQA